MMTEGTKTRSSLKISEEVERLGAALSVSSSYGSTVIAPERIRFERQL